jgi:predicted nucleic acid-binding protein
VNSAVFADTFFWIALTNPADSRHREAHILDASLAGTRIVTTDEVLAEFLTFFASDPWLRNRAARTVQRLLAKRSVRLIPQSRQSFLAGLELYVSRPDKRYSLTDCVSMETMRQEGLTQVLTNDRHFEQEGFQMLLRGDN